MHTPNALGGLRAFGRLRQFTLPEPTVERCDLCSVPLGPEHRHLLEPAERRLICACNACALLFPSQAGTRLKRVPQQIHNLMRFNIKDAEWDSLRLPINLAFLFHRGTDNRVVACYPSPAGATESLLPLATWHQIRQNNPILLDMADDVEALLVNRVGYARGVAPAKYFIVSVDHAYRLVGLIRLHWRGLCGGAEVWKEVDTFFSDLARRAGGKEGR